MSTIVYHVNAFTVDANSGNPAGVVLDADHLNDAQMLEIAKRVGFSETAFICKSSHATKRLRFFTPTSEVDLCGHATIASWSLLYQRHLIGKGSAIQDTLAGLLKIQVGDQGFVYMEQTEADFYEIVDAEIIAPILGIASKDVSAFFLPQVVSTGLKDLIVVVEDEKILYGISPNFEAIAQLSKDLDITGVHVLCLLRDRPSVAAARNFSPLVGIDEEAATETSNGASLCYLKRYGGLPAQDNYRIEQGKSMDRISYIYGRFENQTVWIGGNAVIVREIEVDV